MTSLTTSLLFLFLTTAALAGVIGYPRDTFTFVSGDSGEHAGYITFYNTGTASGPGTGSCGKTLSDQDTICALSHELYDRCTFSFMLPPFCQTPLADSHTRIDTPKEADGVTLGNPNANSLCGKKIKVTGPKGDIVVTVADRCEGCGEYDIDLTPAVFDSIVNDPVATGNTTATWQWVN